MIRIEGGDRVRRRLGDPGLVTDPLGDLLVDMSAEAQRVARAGAPRVVARSLRSEVHGLRSSVSSLHPAALPTEVGRRPGGRMPPLAAIAAWAAERGIHAQPFVLARAIARRGVRGRFYMRATVDHLERRMPVYLGELSRAIARRWNS